MKRIILIFSLLVSAFALMAQKGTIKGRIYNAKTNEPLEFANILIQGTLIGSTSDLDGNYIFTGIDPGFKQLVVSLVGYETTLSPEIQVQGNQTVFLDISVNETTQVLNEFVVKRNINAKKIESPISVISLGVQEIEKSAGVNRDVSKLVQTLPGVGVTDPNRNDLIVRGGGPSENVFYLDGIEIPVINHFTTQGSSGGTIGIINPDFVQDISFYTGAFPANRTNALSSVMEIRQREGNKDRLQGKISVGASDAAFTLDGPIGERSNFILSARQSCLQFLFDVIGLPFLPTYNDFQLKYKFDFDKKNQLTILGIGAIDDMVLNLGIENPTESQSYLLAYLPVYKQWNYTVGAVYKHFAENHFDTWVLSRNMLRNANFKYLDNDETKERIQDYLSDEIENKFRGDWGLRSRAIPTIPTGKSSWAIR
ncbi:MAG: TonB-dependent receptor [Bacteroidales bacterium]|nr:TonB-dependent receptor [Bacteroidales bacterium]